MGAGGNVYTNRPTSKYNTFILGSSIGAINLFSRKANKSSSQSCCDKNTSTQENDRMRLLKLR